MKESPQQPRPIPAIEGDAISVRCGCGKPCSRRCPSLDAAMIDGMAQGEIEMKPKRKVANQPLAPLELTASAVERLPKQPCRLHFDAEDVQRLSLAGHPWQAEAIQKAG